MTMLILLFFLLVTAGSSREYTADELARFPKLFHLDDYDRCLAQRDGLYCLGILELSPAQLPNPTYEMMKAFSDESTRHFNRTRIHRGYCVSARCPTGKSMNASQVIERDASKRFERCVNHYAATRSLQASLHTLHYCHTHAEKYTEKPLTTGENIFIQVLYAIIALNVIGTIYDVFTADGPNKNKLLSAFSVPANWRRLTAVHEVDHRISCLDPVYGLRVLGLALSSYAHASVLHFTFYTSNPEFLEELTQSVTGIYLSDGTSLIQGFMVVSCFLTGYNLLLYSQKHELSLRLLPLCIVKRVIRIVPVHLLVVGFGATWWVYTRDGPTVPITIGLESEACKNKMWSHVFFVNNIVDPGNYCVLPTWFLPVDMHLYILACTLTLLLWRRRCTAVKLYFFLFIASCVLTGVIGYVKNYMSMTYLATPEQIRRMFRDSPSFTDYYISSWSSLSCCFLGLLLANIHYEISERKINLSNHKWFVYLHFTTFPLLFLWALTGVVVRNHTSHMFHAIHLAFDKPIYCVLVIINLLAIFHIDSPIRRFFAWRGWHPLARMSLTVMLCHWSINMIIGTRPIAFGTSTIDIIVDWLATNLMTYIIAAPVTTLVEIPMQRFLGALLF